MKKVIFILFFIFMVIVFDTKIFPDTLYNVYYKLNNKTYKIVENTDILNSNDYTKKDYSSYVSSTDSLTAHNKQELTDIYYSAVNQGYDKLTFYCDASYHECGDDINYLNKEDNNFSYINQLVGVYNTYSAIESTYSTNLRVDISIERKYQEEDIKMIDDAINIAIDELDINNYEDVVNKIKVFHDFIASTTSYDQDRANNLNSPYRSDSAYGPLFEDKAICSGYSDAMSLFLDKLGLENIRVATDSHVWNAVLINNIWYHIDLTWDDPIVTNGGDIIQYDYFLITTDELESLGDDEHDFNKEVYDFL